MRSKPPPNLKKRILHGEQEPVFRALPQSTLNNLRSPTSESAVLWNLIYPLARPHISLLDLLSIRPVWGSDIEVEDDDLVPYFWGYAVSGDRMPGLDETLDEVESIGPQTEIDLFFKGDRSLIIIEAKHLARLGRCSRFQKARCPEVHGSPTEESCRYWERPISIFSSVVDFGARPDAETDSPICHRHYQLGRTLLLGIRLAKSLGLIMHFWLFLPRTRWRAIERDWIDFADRVRDEEIWKRLRVICLEDLRQISKA